MHKSGHKSLAVCCTFALAVIWILAATLAAQDALPHASPSDRAEALAIFKQLIETNTTDTPQGSVTAATEQMKLRFLDAGFAESDVHLIGPDAKKMNLVVRYRAEGTPTEKPVLFLCHMDVVEALRADWSTDPFKFVEKDGYWYGRGTQDMKDSDAVLAQTFIRLHREGYKPKRDLILALTADEEGGKFNGASWLVNTHRDLVDVAYVINPDAAAELILKTAGPRWLRLRQLRKVYSDFQITATNRGGHSSLPRPDNAIYELMTALDKLSTYSFPFELNEVTRTYFANLAKRETGQIADDMRAILEAATPDMAATARLSASPSYNSNFRTTCVATRGCKQATPTTHCRNRRRQS